MTADPKSKSYGTNDPALTYAASGFVNGTVDGVAISDTAGNSLSGSLTRAGFGTRAGENVGSYAITQGSLAAQNYTIAYTGANLSIFSAGPAPSPGGGGPASGPLEAVSPDKYFPASWYFP